MYIILYMSIDESIFYAFYNIAGQSALGDFLIIFLGEYLIYIVLVIFLGVAFHHWFKMGIHVMEFYIFALLATTVAEGASMVIKLLTHRPRPFLEFSIPHLLTDGSYAFPSGHTTLLFALATATYFFNKKLAYFIFICGLLVGMGRIAGSVHYPSDILGGAILGILGGIVVYKLCIKYFFYFPKPH